MDKFGVCRTLKRELAPGKAFIAYVAMGQRRT